jgi:hypothetical protein
MRLFLRPSGVAMDSVLFIESGSRALAERFLTHLYTSHPAQRVDVLTCYEGAPSSFDPSRGTVISIHSASGFSGRRQLITALARNGYSVVSILCSGEPIMTRWKWALALRVPAKLLVVNENVDYFWFDRGNFGSMRAMVKHRFGMHTVSSPQLAISALLFPFIFLYLLAYAGWIHTRRLLRSQ